MTHKKVGHLLISGLERLFEWWAGLVTASPALVIVSSLIVTLICAVGFVNFKVEHRANFLWIPPTSSFNDHVSWMNENFRKSNRDEIVLIKSEDNILTPEGLRMMHGIHKAVAGIQAHGKRFEDICTRVPVGNVHWEARRRRRRRETFVSEQALGGASLGGGMKDLFEDAAVNRNALGWRRSLEQLPPNETETAYLYVDYTESGQQEAYDFYGNYDDFYNDPIEEVDYDNYHTLFDDQRVAKLVDFAGYNMRSRFEDEGEELDPRVYCDQVVSSEERCLEVTLLDIWGYDEQVLANITQQEIIEAVNVLEVSPWFGHAINFTKLLGGLIRNETGHVVGARSAEMYWNIRIPEGAELVQSQGSGVELDLADEVSLAWEAAFLEHLLNNTESQEGGSRATVYVSATRSFGDVSAKAIFFDGLKMAVGYVLMFAYTILMMGRVNRVELRFYLGLAGIVSVGMGLVVAMGLSSALGFPYTPVHAVLPFLCLGIGIDDMFVIMQYFGLANKDPSTKHLPLVDRVAQALRHAGVSITVTSVTDVLVFGVGAMTQMPGLQSFCICCAIGLGAIFLLQVSWFVAFLYLDELRIEQGRDALVPCLVLNDRKVSTAGAGTAPAADPEVPPSCWPAFQENIRSVYRKFVGLLNYKTYKAAVVVLTILLAGLGGWGSFLMRQKFEPINLLPTDSYVSQFVSLHESEFPHSAPSWWTAEVYTGPINYTQIGRMESMVGRLEELFHTEQFIRGLDCWWTSLRRFAAERRGHPSLTNVTADEFPVLLSDFLFSRLGIKYQHVFKWDRPLVCNSPAPNIIASKFAINYMFFDGPEEHGPAKRTVESVIRSANVSETAFSHVKFYAAWETDEIIGYELWRNIGVSTLCVLVITLLLLMNVPVCLMVLFCVVITIVDVIGYLHFWGITIDIISCIGIVLAIGLCVDYSVHVVHGYLISEGGRRERAQQSLVTIGPAVINGGVTTFLALLLLIFSSSHVFISFFKVFSLTVSFGLYHGLVFLPVVLSLVGPVSNSEEEEHKKDVEKVQSYVVKRVSNGSVGPLALPER